MATLCVPALGCRIGAAVPPEEPCQTQTHTTSERQTRRSRPVLALGCCVAAMLNERPGHIHITRKDVRCRRGDPSWLWVAASSLCSMTSQAKSIYPPEDVPYSVTVLAWGCRIAAVLDEKPGQTRTHRTPLGRQTQRSHPVLALGCRVGAMLDEEPGHIHLTP